MSLNTFHGLMNRISTAAASLAGLALVIMMVQVTLDVVLKYLFNSPIPATLETVASYYMVAVVYLPLGIVTRDRAHIEVELFTQGLSERRLAWVKGVTGILVAFYVGAMIYRGTLEAVHMTTIRESWETALWDMYVWPSRWFVPVGCAVMLVYVVLHFIDDLYFAATGRRLIDG